MRLGNMTAWLKKARPDVVLLQELKCTEDALPRLEIEDLGYNIAAVGQKSYNGVAILSRTPLEIAERALPGLPNDDAQARYIEAVISIADGKSWKALRVASIYLPNGNPVESDKYPYKLSWMEQLKQHAAYLLKLEEPVILGGDYNVAPTDDDVYDPAGWRDDALCRVESRAKFRSIVNLGYTDAFRALNDAPHRYTFWDYKAGRWERDEGLRIDHLLLSPQAMDCLESCDIDRGPRGAEKPSDHTPIWCTLKL